MNGNQADTSAPDRGAVYVFTRSGTVWTQQAYLKQRTPASCFTCNGTETPSPLFGGSVSLADDGNTLVVGAPGDDRSDANNGAVYVFVRNGTVWSEQAQFNRLDAQEQLGLNVQVSGDGATFAAQFSGLGASGQPGAVNLYTLSNGSWTLQTALFAPTRGDGDFFGAGLGLSRDGNTLAVGAIAEDSARNTQPSDNSAANSGAAYIFTRSGSMWTLQAFLKGTNTDAGDRFGLLSLSDDGNTLAVGAPGEASSTSGLSTDAAADNASASAGAAYLFTRNTSGVWEQQTYIKAPNPGATDLFGTSVALAGNGTTLAVIAPQEDSSARGVGGNQGDEAAPNSGAIYIY